MALIERSRIRSLADLDTLVGSMDVDAAVASYVRSPRLLPETALPVQVRQPARMREPREGGLRGEEPFRQANRAHGPTTGPPARRSKGRAMIIKAYYAGGRIDVFDTDRMTDGIPQPGNLLTNYTLDLSDVGEECLWLRSYYYEAADAYKDEPGPTGPSHGAPSRRLEFPHSR